MVIDSSALAAILFQESDAKQFANAINRSPIRLVSTCTLVETSIVIESRAGADGVRELDMLVHKNIFEIVAFDIYQATLARYAFATYGKGRHKAGLNMGDCFSYALAKAKNMALLYKGNDFTQTDMISAMES